jgi:hypothetical protein
LNLAIVPPGNNTGNPPEPMSYNNAYKKVKNYLGNMLRGLVCGSANLNALLITGTLGPTAAVSELKRQLDAYGTVKTMNMDILSTPAPHSELKNIPLSAGDPTTMLESLQSVCSIKGS